MNRLLDWYLPLPQMSVLLLNDSLLTVAFSGSINFIWPNRIDEL